MESRKCRAADQVNPKFGEELPDLNIQYRNGTEFSMICDELPDLNIQYSKETEFCTFCDELPDLNIQDHKGADFACKHRLATLPNSPSKRLKTSISSSTHSKKLKIRRKADIRKKLLRLFGSVEVSNTVSTIPKRLNTKILILFGFKDQLSIPSNGNISLLI